ncbi:MAG TPA: septum formation initiator family protein [bacterium]|nr:septum formation initiator family protein [bacterium]
MTPKKKRIKNSHLINFTFNNILYVAAVCVFVAFFSLTVWGDGGLTELHALKAKRDGIIKQSHFLLRENLFFLQEMEELKKSRYIEQRVRTDLGYIRPDEIMYVVK